MERMSCRTLSVLVVVALSFLALAHGKKKETVETTITTSCGVGCTSYFTGNPDDVTTATSSGINLEGGSTDLDEAFRWMIHKSGGGDFVILRTAGTGAYNDYIYTTLGGVNSVQTFVLTERNASYLPIVADRIRKAEALFLAGGDQSTYVAYWKDTPVASAIDWLAGVKGVPIGGTSAGLAVLGQWIYTGANGSADSRQALSDPFNTNMTFARDFLTLKHMHGIITDTHFHQRDRMGRLVAFMARVIADGWSAGVWGIGVDERTSFLMEADGRGKVVGKGHAYFLSSTQAPTTCVPGSPLVFLNVKVQKTQPGDSFDTVSWVGGSYPTYFLNAKAGMLTSTQPGGSIY